MDRQDALALLERSRALRYRFPASFGDPGLEGEPLDRAQLVEAARMLDRNEAEELAANTWRLWMLPPRDPEGGLRFLAGRTGTQALYGAGLLALRTGDVGGSRILNEQALECAEDDESRTHAHIGLSRVAHEEGNAQEALDHAQKAHAAGASLPEAVRQPTLHLQAQALRMSGDLDAAAPLFEESLALNGRIGDEGMVGVEHYNLGLVHLRRGDTEAAVRYLSEVSDDPLAAAGLAYAKGDAHGATAWLEQVGSDLPVEDAAERDWLREQLAGP
jgi:tetratricopeptide (TPR) repeat protein